MSIKKENEYDALGKRMKRYEAVANNQLLIPDLPLYIRLDGRHFSKLTEPLGYPYPDLKEKASYVFSDLIAAVAKDLICEFRPDIVEFHSDEISLGYKSIKTAPFEGKYFKLISNIASYAGMSFMKNVFTFAPPNKEIEYLAEQSPSFDCRAVQLPDLMELVNCFVWRQNDCIRGTINQYAQRWFSHKKLLGKSQEQRIEMLNSAGHDVEKNIALEVHGHWYVKQPFVENIQNQYKQFHPGENTLVRNRYTAIDFKKPLAQIENKIEFLFEGALPEYAS